ncbi:MAG: universal stress protein [Betaproteobacteria bacterium]
MFKHIMIPVDGSELADKAVGEGLKLAKAFGAKVTALIAEHEYEVPTYTQITSHSAVSVPEHERRIKEHAAKILEAVSARAKELGVRFEGRLMEDDEPYAAIVKAATEGGVDLIVMASHGRHGLGALFFGSQTQEVMSHSKIPVLVYR